MANNLAASFRKIWAKEMQEIFTKVNVSMGITSNKFLPDLTRGKTLTRPYYTENTIQDYTRGSDLTEQAVNSNEETLSVDKEFGDLFYIDKFDKLQSAFDDIQKFGNLVSRKISNQLDADVLSEVRNADSVLDGGDVTGGTAGDGIALTTTTFPEVIGGAKKSLRKKNIGFENAFMVISPSGEDVAYQYGISRETTMGDVIYKNGFVGKVNGFRVFVSNNLTGSQTLDFATNWTAGDTLTVNGVVLTAAAAPSGAGEIDVAADADTSRGLIATVLNASGATSSSGEYVAVSAADQLKLRNIVATNDDTNNRLTVFGKGIPELAVSASLTAGSDGWDSDKAITHFIAGIQDCITVVVQSNPSMLINQAPKRNGKFIVSTILYGIKSFKDGRESMVNIKVKMDS